MNDLIKMGIQIIEAQPFSVLLGAKVTAVEGDKVEISLEIRDELKQQNGFVHGGVLSYLADNALTFSGALALASPVVTSEMKVNYVRPAIGEILIVRAKTAHKGKSQAVTQCEVFVVKDGVEKLCLLGQGTIVKTDAALV